MAHVAHAHGTRPTDVHQRLAVTWPMDFENCPGLMYQFTKASWQNGSWRMDFKKLPLTPRWPRRVSCTFGPAHPSSWQNGSWRMDLENCLSLTPRPAHRY